MRKCHQEGERMGVRREWQDSSEERDMETGRTTGGFLFGDDKVLGRGAMAAVSRHEPRA